jgi:Transcriptional regulator, contains sigma factor-related N-terminal domain
MMPRYISELELALHISKLYYLQNYTQQEISAQYNLSRAKVQRLLQKARDVGIVKIEIVSPFPACDDLGSMICSAFPVKEAIVVPVQSDSQAAIRETLGSLAADYITGKIIDGQVLGIGWGRTVYESVRFWNSQVKAKAKIVPLFGGFGQTEPCYQTNDMAMQIASSLGGTSNPLFAPVIVESKMLRDALFDNQTIKQVSQLWDQVDIALLGIGTSLDTVVGAHWSAYVSEEDLNEVKSKGVVGDVALYLFNKDGQIVDTTLSSRLINIKLHQLKKIPQVIGVSGGKEKAQAVAAALKTGLIHVIITDQATAKAVLELS